MTESLGRQVPANASADWMNQMKATKFLVALGCTALLGAAVPASASAILQLIDNEGHSAQVTGSTPTLSLSVNNANGSFTGSPWSFAIAVGTNATTVLGIPDIDFDLTATAARAGSLTAIYSISDLTYGTGLHSVSVASLISSLYTSGIMWNVCVDDGNVLTAQTLCSGFSSTPSGSLTIPDVVLDGTFSLTIVGRLIDTSSSRLSINAVTAIPEPQSLLLLGIGLLMLAGLRWRTERSKR